MVTVIGNIALGICIGVAVGMTVQFFSDRRCIKDIQNIYETEIARIKAEYKHREHIRILKSNHEQTQLLISQDWIDIDPLPVSRDFNELDFGGRF